MNIRTQNISRTVFNMESSNLKFVSRPRVFLQLKAAHSALGLFLLASLSVTSGCNTAATSSSSEEPKTAAQLYEPAPTRSPQSGNFEKLWTASEDATRDLLFVLDRRDRRSGVITTLPLTAAQWFEPWRQDNQTIGDVGVSSLSTLRRTVRLEFTRAGDQENLAWSVSPKVLVERQARVENRLTSSTQYRAAFRTSVANSALAAASASRGNAMQDADEPVAGSSYWYPVARDAALEREIARRIEQRMRD